MTADLATPLATIELWLQRLDRRVLLKSLQHGLPSASVEEALSEVGLASSPELVSLYAWRNGTSTAGAPAIDDIHLFPGFYLLSLEDALANYRAFVDDARWHTGWLPVFANGGGDFYVMELGPAADGAVRHFRIDDSEHPIEFDSLEALLTTLAAGFERDVLFVDDDGYLEMNDLAFGDLAAELNPGVSWWRDQ